MLAVGMAMASHVLYVERPEDAILLERMRAGQWTSIVAPPTMGKSSMFFRIFRQLRQEGYQIAHADISLCTDRTDEVLELSRKIVRSLELSMTRDLECFDRYEEMQSVFAEYETEDQKLWFLLERMLQAHCSKERDSTKKVVLCIDEIQALGVWLHGDRFIETMDAVMGKLLQSPWKERVSLCFIGWTAFPNDKSPIIREHAPIVSLKDFPTNDPHTIDVFSKAFARSGLCDDIKHAIRTVLELTGGQPLTTCVTLEEVLRQAEDSSPPKSYDEIAIRIAENPEAITSQLRFYMDHLFAIAGRSSDAMECLRQLIRASDASLECDVLPPGMEMLIVAGIVRQNGTRYEIKSPLFRDWFSNV